jgi:hypothetical protein
MMVSNKAKMLLFARNFLRDRNLLNSWNFIDFKLNFADALKVFDESYNKNFLLTIKSEIESKSS